MTYPYAPVPEGAAGRRVDGGPVVVTGDLGRAVTALEVETLVAGSAVLVASVPVLAAVDARRWEPLLDTPDPGRPPQPTETAAMVAATATIRRPRPRSTCITMLDVGGRPVGSRV